MESQNVSALSPEPSAAVATIPTTAEVVADTLENDLLVGAFDDAAWANTQSSAKLTRMNTMAANNISLEHLFGRGYGAILSVDANQPAHDPALLDTDAIFQDVFGQQVGFVHDAFATTTANIYSKHQQALQDAKHADCMSELDVLFGPNADFVKNESGVSLRPNVTMSAAYPNKEAPPTDKAAALLNSTLLLTMPTVYPNRQILHFDTNPYNPMTSRPKESTDRKTFTPQNIMMWTYEPKTKQFLSNTRVIQWSDGTTTLHVGAESYDMETYTDGALSFLGERRHMFRCDKAYSAIIETVPVDNHVTVRSRSDKQNSIDFVTATKTARSMAENIALTVGLPMTGLPAFVGDAGRKSVEEEYVDAERAALKKLIADLERKGTPMSRAEQMRRDAQILHDVINIGKGIDTLVAKQNEKKRAEEVEREAAKAEREAANAMKLGSKRIRIPGGLDGGADKKSRTEKKTDREPDAEFYAQADAEERVEDVAAAKAGAEDISGEKWREAAISRLKAIAAEAFAEDIKSIVEDTIQSVGLLSRNGAAEDFRKFIGEVESESTITDSLAHFEALVQRLEEEDA